MKGKVNNFPLLICILKMENMCSQKNSIWVVVIVVEMVVVIVRIFLLTKKGTQLYL